MQRTHLILKPDGLAQQADGDRQRELPVGFVLVGGVHVLHAVRAPHVPAAQRLHIAHHRQYLPRHRVVPDRERDLAPQHRLLHPVTASLVFIHLSTGMESIKQQVASFKKPQQMRMLIPLEENIAPDLTERIHRLVRPKYKFAF